MSNAIVERIPSIGRWRRTGRNSACRRGAGPATFGTLRRLRTIPAIHLSRASPPTSASTTAPRSTSRSTSTPHQTRVSHTTSRSTASAITAATARRWSTRAVSSTGQAQAEADFRPGHRHGGRGQLGHVERAGLFLRDAVSGVYLAKLVRDDGTDATNQIPFIVRNDDGPKSDIVLQTSDTTWHAYNGWAGNNGDLGGQLLR